MRKAAGVLIGTLCAIVCIGVMTHPSHVQAAQDTSSYKLVENWAQIPDGASWGQVSGVGIDAKGNIYTLERDEPSSKVLVFDSHGKFIKKFGEGISSGVQGMSVLPDGSVWVADRKTQQAFKFSSDGKLLVTLGQKDVSGDDNSADAFNGVSGFALAKNGDVFVTDGEGPNSRIVKFTKDGKLIKFWGTKGSGQGQMSGPHAAAVDSKGNVWVCDRGNKRLQVFDADGKYLQEMTQFGTPLAIAIKGDTVYVVDDRPQDQLVIGTTDGKILDKISGLNFAHSIAISDSGEIYIAETSGKNVLKFVKK